MYKAFLKEDCMSFIKLKIKNVFNDIEHLRDSIFITVAELNSYVKNLKNVTLELEEELECIKEIRISLQNTLKDIERM